MLTAEEARELFSYDPETGRLYWRSARGNRREGARAGHTQAKGYVTVHTRGRGWYVHRIAWLIMTGSWPANEVDHVDGDKGNNRWDNLRDVPRSENLRARRRSHQDIRQVRSKWVAFKRVVVGTFDTIDDAIAARDVARRSAKREQVVLRRPRVNSPGRLLP